MVPVLGSPVMNTGRSMATSAYSGFACQAASLNSLAVSDPRSSARCAFAPSGVSRRVGREGVEQHREPVGVVIRAEVGEAGPPRRGRVQVLDGADAGWRVIRAQWWYSPQLTSRHWPVMARAIGEARNTTASAISSGSGSRPRSMGAAVSA